MRWRPSLLLRALANERRLLILDWLRDPKKHFREQVDGDLIDDGVCGNLIAEKNERGACTMILIGQYDSPFVRRVAIALRLYGLLFEHKPWSTFGDGDKIAAFNPLRRVPTLVLDGGEALIESGSILDYLDELVGPEKAMIPARGPERRHQLRICALASGLGDKSVSLVYESALRKEQLKLWVDRCEAQITGALDVLEKERVAAKTPFLFGERIGHSDIIVTCVLRFTHEAHPQLYNASRYPALSAHAARCEALPAFKEIVQPLAPPSG
jgi:glutathione S-transferase